MALTRKSRWVAALKDIKPGASHTFHLSEVRQIYSLKSIAYKYQRIIGCRFQTHADFINTTLMITRL